MSSWAEERFEVSRLTEEELRVPNVTIKYGDDLFYCEGDYDEVCKAIVDGKPLDVSQWVFDDLAYPTSRRRRITFFGDPEWVSVEL
jgi:hypothetical protein